MFLSFGVAVDKRSTTKPRRNDRRNRRGRELENMQGNPTGSRAATFPQRIALKRTTCELRRIHWNGRVKHIELHE